ncbi:MAG TPA: hypothetical protein VM118_10445 [Acidobacteriota bacterium]|nr:hypothetical protein [Acidobacteriota bacterium]
MSRTKTAVCLLGVAALIASCGQDQSVSSGNESSETPVLTATVADTVVLSYGETVVVEPEVLEVTFDAVLQDSRCPSDVICVWEGIAIIQLQLVALPADTHLIVLANHDNVPWDVGPVVDTLGYTFQLVSLDPYPVSTRQIPDDEYVATLLIVGSWPAGSVAPEITVPRRPSKTQPTTLPEDGDPIDQ